MKRPAAPAAQTGSVTQVPTAGGISPRDPLVLLRAAFLLGAIALAADGHAALAGLVAFFMLASLLPGALGVPRPFEAAFTIGMCLQSIGNVLGLFEPEIGYDMLVHSVLSGSAGAASYLALIRHGLLPDPAAGPAPDHRIGVFLVVAALGMALGSLWEVVEYGSDELFGTSLVKGSLDTLVDLAANTIGSLAAGLTVVTWSWRYPEWANSPRE